MHDRITFSFELGLGGLITWFALGLWISHRNLSLSNAATFNIIIPMKLLVTYFNLLEKEGKEGENGKRDGWRVVEGLASWLNL